ncbi:MAG: AmmeMemoRadiSam system protein B [Candidatus Omnitrophica bacterium]|nr:AmmeMemoRadiSam system protein B [Candidatus Omnitrophota bacterium]
MPAVRPPRVAGQFYPANKKTLHSFLKEHIPSHRQKKKVIGVIMPHAGYIYSGTTAAVTIAHVDVPDSVVLLGPNHTGAGEAFSLMSCGTWQMPLGDVAINEQLASELIESSSYIKADTAAHRLEHSLEVELPFLYFLNNNVTIVPLTIGSHNLEHCRAVGNAIAQCLRGKNVLIVASSDMTHYESHQAAEKKDKEAISAIQQLDEDALAETVSRLNISMCGFIPVYILLVAAKALGATTAQLIDYRTSGEASGDFDQVVGYAGMIIE